MNILVHVTTDVCKYILWGKFHESEILGQSLYLSIKTLLKPALPHLFFFTSPLFPAFASQALGFVFLFHLVSPLLCLFRSLNLFFSGKNDSFCYKVSHFSFSLQTSLIHFTFPLSSGVSGSCGRSIFPPTSLHSRPVPSESFWDLLSSRIHYLMFP